MQELKLTVRYAKCSAFAEGGGGSPQAPPNSYQGLCLPLDPAGGSAPDLVMPRRQLLGPPLLLDVHARTQLK